MTDEKLVSEFHAICQTNEEFKRKVGHRLFRRLQSDGRKNLLRKLIKIFNAYDTHNHFLKFGTDNASHAASFRVAITQRTRRMKKLGRHTCPEWMLWNKPEGTRFARKLGLRHAIQLDLVTHKALSFRPGIVVKPKDGSFSYGVYLVFSEDRIGDVKRNAFFSGYDELHRRIIEDLNENRVRKDCWIVEELFENCAYPTGVAPDWKFYVFYGQIMQIGFIQRFPKQEEIWFDEKGQKVDRGYESDTFTLNIPKIDADLLKTARDISLQIPAPFIRIDLLETDMGPVFGEFTAKPGVWHMFGRKLDMAFGDAFIAAEVRLQADLLAGKDFETWKAFAADSPYRDRSCAEVGDDSMTA